ncbi:MAG: carboxylate--amine ligase [Candidatus Nephthysia bennettiae]|uniref:ATP-grasp domain-containing protein n=1 Tax=Candidatus Nephthysia bennettiae TaxID=3127016 RepID=A0A934K2U4_9BACT|nr:ATP-grasp domain-containing protein [Candidatus Dormibacteraeota bacterium]MBJ7610781.1 ATP-grasp domain-containing protein [Candidatus Dormibacteraeota bacterium]PZR87459.1 MAG: carboxylate--amine ligase [Candidatus Dormibacteraeota bacterium]
MSCRVLIVGGGSELQPQLRRVAAGVETVVLCRASSFPYVREPQENRAVVMLNDACTPAWWIGAARAIHAQWRFEALAAFADLDQDRAAAIATDLQLPFHSPETVQLVQDKVRMRARLRERGVESVPCRAIDSMEALTLFYRETGPPVILKPSRGWASTGISVVNSEENLAGAFRRTVQATPFLVGPSPPMAERCFEGREFSVEAITHRGVHHVFAVTEKFKDERTKVELGHLVPARITGREERLLIEHVRAALTALGVGFGPTHTEVILSSQGPVIVETHLRDGGDEIPRLVEDATGVDMADLFLRQVLGADIGALPEFESRREGPRYTAGGAIRYIALDCDGILERIGGWDQVRALPGVRASMQLVPDGTALDGLNSSFARLGYVRVQAADAEAALKLAREAAKGLAVRLRA